MRTKTKTRYKYQILLDEVANRTGNQKVGKMALANATYLGKIEDLGRKSAKSQSDLRKTIKKINKI